MGFDEFRVLQAAVGEVERRCGITFSAVLAVADTVVVPESFNRRTPPDVLEDIRW
ncbi:hypothetical protein [Saccharothrix sp. Mg75]|uniref:hypothetical protein n=1 Tax=Saccharothrix sp. Mg75 TaxID=3445357 RepID=UPI003EEE26E2